MRKNKVTKKKLTPSYREIFENPSVPHFGLLNNFLALVTIIAVTIVALETVASLARFQSIFLIIEYFAVGIFLTEYIARLYFTKNRLRYVFSFFWNN